MKKHSLILLAAGSLFSLASCGDNDAKKNTMANDSSAVAAPMQPVTLASVTPSPDFPNATLAISSEKSEKAGKDSAKITFKFDVKNFELKMQTSDNGNKLCNNSAQGQHIHFILDNKPYKALYEPTNEITVANGTEHYLIAFLSRSYHESIKSQGAAVVSHFSIDAKGNWKKMELPKTPMLAYSRPKGDYLGKDTANVLLDFYVANCTLAADGYKVKVEISNESKPGQQLNVILDKWEPHFIENLGTGKCKVTLTLTDKDGKAVDGPMTTATREFNLMAQEPMK